MICKLYFEIVAPVVIGIFFFILGVISVIYKLCFEPIELVGQRPIKEMKMMNSKKFIISNDQNNQHLKGGFRYRKDDDDDDDDLEAENEKYMSENKIKIENKNMKFSMEEIEYHYDNTDSKKIKGTANNRPIVARHDSLKPMIGLDDVQSNQDIDKLEGIISPYQFDSGNEENGNEGQNITVNTFGGKLDMSMDPLNQSVNP